MKRVLSIIFFVCVLCVGTYLCQQKQSVAPLLPPISLTVDEQREIFDLENQIENLRLKQENAILRAANDHGVSLKTYQLIEVNGQLRFGPRPAVGAAKQPLRP